MTTTVQPVFSIVAMDITSFCNLRCPFCLSSHDLPKVFMNEEVFEKAISLIPLAVDNNFLFSCLYEPTLHPGFLAYLKKIPEKYRDKVFFSTNLAKRISDDVFEGLSQSGLHHINISLDSLDPPVYESFRKGAKFTVFHDNLTRLVKIFSQKKEAPEIYYISVVNKLNYQEIPSIVEQCCTRYLGKFHDIREYWLLSHQRELDWCLENKMSDDELETLKESLSRLTCDFSFAEAGRDLGTLLPDNNYKGQEVIDEEGRGDNLYYNPYDGAGIRIQADGTVEVLGRNVHFNLQDIDSPVSFMSDFSSFIQLDLEKTDEMLRVAGKLIREALEVQAGLFVQYNIDEVFFVPKTLKLCGWCFHHNGKELDIYIKLPDTPRVRLESTRLSSPDVEAIHGAHAAMCRFELRVNLNYAYSPEDLMGICLEFEVGKGQGKSVFPGYIPWRNLQQGLKKSFNKCITGR